YPDPETNQMVYPKLELVRLALPRRVYTQSHLDYVVETIGKTKERCAQIPGYHLTYAPKLLRQFTAQLVPIESGNGQSKTSSERSMLSV
ncbi:MAG: hypothetical protein ACRC1Z_00420, partial [Waterburya sp.]